MDSIVKFAELEKFLDTKLKHFSIGMRARLAFSTAIHVDPDIMLIDEALSVGDLSFRRKCYDVISDLKKKGKTIVFVSHSLDEIEAFSDTALWIHEGVINSYGKPSEVVGKFKQFINHTKN